MFLRAGAVGAAGAAAWGSGALRATQAGAQSAPSDPADLLGPFGRYGPLKSDPEGILDLPEGFDYTILTRTGDTMRGGDSRPAIPDGMENFDAGGGRQALCCNHEVRIPGRQENSALMRVGDRPSSGAGCTTLIVNPDNTVEEQFVSQSDTSTNCAGGRTPWGTWLTCEEIEAPPTTGQTGPARGYGYVYEVDPFTEENGPYYPAMGQFFHEAVVFHPNTGTVYQTEDRQDGLFYRFIPESHGDLTSGRLEAMEVMPPRGRGDRLQIRWIDLTDVAQVSSETLRTIGAQRGATQFNGCEGIAEFGGSIYFDEGQGGAAGLGRIWRVRPAQNTIELFFESEKVSELRQPDNMRQQPGTGDLFYCEDTDGSDPNNLVVQAGTGQVFTFARDRTDSEFAGACWDPSGDRLFVNLQQAGLTLVVTGPFRPALAAERQRAVAMTAPTGGRRRGDPDTVAKAVRDRGMGPLETEAALALGHSVA
jgi:secreted PhoX family phosphatase